MTKSLADIGGTTIQNVGPLSPMEPVVHTMSNELIPEIPCNIFLAFKWILMMKSGHNISNYTASKLSVHVSNVFFLLLFDMYHYSNHSLSAFLTVMPAYDIMFLPYKILYLRQCQGLQPKGDSFLSGPRLNIKTILPCMGITIMEIILLIMGILYC